MGVAAGGWKALNILVNSPEPDDADGWLGGALLSRSGKLKAWAKSSEEAWGVGAGAGGAGLCVRAGAPNNWVNAPGLAFASAPGDELVFTGWGGAVLDGSSNGLGEGGAADLPNIIVNSEGLRCASGAGVATG
jgi:hypothetical protein